MGQPVAIICMAHTAAELRSQAVRSDDADQARRLLAIAMILDGVSRAEPHARPAWTARRCVTGCTATISRVWTG
jgi:hypothetical protein